MIPTSKSSQVLALLPQSNQPKCLKPLQQIKPFLLLWKSQQILAKVLAMEKKLWLPQAKTRTRMKVKARFQMLPFLSPSKLLTPKFPRQKLRTLVLLLRLFYLSTVFVYFFFFFKDLYYVFIINEYTLLLF